MKFNKKTVTEKLHSIISFFFIYFVIYLIICDIVFGADFLTALSASASAISNVGPGISEL